MQKTRIATAFAVEALVATATLALVRTGVNARKPAQFAPLSLGGKSRYTIAESLASSSHSSPP